MATARQGDPVGAAPATNELGASIGSAATSATTVDGAATATATATPSAAAAANTSFDGGSSVTSGAGSASGGSGDGKDANGGAAGKMTKTGFKRTKAGCLNCKFRKVKCDERQPQCSSCIRLGIACGGHDHTLSKNEYGAKKQEFLRMLAARPPLVAMSSSSIGSCTGASGSASVSAIPSAIPSTIPNPMASNRPMGGSGPHGLPTTTTTTMPPLQQIGQLPAAVGKAKTKTGNPRGRPRKIKTREQGPMTSPPRASEHALLGGDLGMQAGAGLYGINGSAAGGSFHSLMPDDAVARAFRSSPGPASSPPQFTLLPPHGSFSSSISTSTGTGRSAVAGAGAGADLVSVPAMPPTFAECEANATRLGAGAVNLALPLSGAGLPVLRRSATTYMQQQQQQQQQHVSARPPGGRQMPASRAALQKAASTSALPVSSTSTVQAMQRAALERYHIPPLQSTATQARSAQSAHAKSQPSVAAALQARASTGTTTQTPGGMSTATQTQVTAQLQAQTQTQPQTHAQSQTQAPLQAQRPVVDASAAREQKLLAQARLLAQAMLKAHGEMRRDGLFDDCPLYAASVASAADLNANNSAAAGALGERGNDRNDAFRSGGAMSRSRSREGGEFG